MPDRQTSSGEVTTRDADDEQFGGTTGAQGVPVDGDTVTAPSVADQVADQVQAEPDAAEPAPVEPGEAPAADAPVADATVLTEQVTAPHAASPDSPAPEPAGPESAAPAEPAPEGDGVEGAAPTPGPRSESAGRPPSGDDPTVATRLTTDGLGSWFASSDAESTQVIPRDVRPAPGIDAPTEQMQLPASPCPASPPPVDGPAETSGSGRGRKRLLIGAGAVALVGLLYGGDLLLSSGSVPRGTTVAGVPVGGLSLADAEQTLRTQIEPRTTQTVPVTAGEARNDLDPRAAGLTVDWAGTLDRAGSQPLNPITRITSFFTSREVGVATSTDRTALDTALAQLAPAVDKVPVEGTVRFDGVTPVAVDPVPGQKLDAPAAAAVLERDWASGSPVTLPVTTLPAVTTPDQVATAIQKVATPAVSAPVAVLGENGTKGTLEPEVIAKSLSFRADPTGLVPQINRDAVTAALKPQLAASEKPGRDAALDFSSGTAVVVPSQDGRGIDYPATLKDLLPVLTGSGERSITAVYADQPAKLTTEQLGALGISGVIGEFQTGGFASDSGQNIKRAAEQINGKIVQPGETFSLNAVTNPRDAAHGYVEAGIIENGHSARGIGGGVSQVATTLYNAAYFAGMTNVEHKEHSFYISRYPAGREATVFDDVIDLKFRNDNPTAVMIQTGWTPSSLNVKIFGTKVWDVTSTSGPRTNPTSPKRITLPAGDGCKPSQGAPGFTITNTRTLKNVKTGQVRVDPTRTVRYNPSPIVTCT
ncbi:VanW family protein [Pseudonocardia sp. 73-21]|uniref:VanW family protein n=1 Tax=Pseudonocardia sp. 73-21 TaxID=1895809 RepID=UPI00260C7DBC|nr:VanW family protein [Pseudonocardia sp. 73-21]